MSCRSLLLLILAGFLFLPRTHCKRSFCPEDVDLHSNSARSLPNAPDGYAPASVNCPVDRPVIRTGSGLSQNETSWLELRRPKTVDAMYGLFDRLNITDFDSSAYLNEHSGNSSALPNIGIAVSGGGYR